MSYLYPFSPIFLESRNLILKPPVIGDMPRVFQICVLDTITTQQVHTLLTSVRAFEWSS